jgi:hypothetical protein
MTTAASKKDYVMERVINTPTMLMVYFDITLGEFQEFWKTLTPEEKNYYRTTILN